MLVYDVVFGEYDRDNDKKQHYYYRANLVLFKGDMYKISNINREYSTPVTIVNVLTDGEFKARKGKSAGVLVEIVKAVPTDGSMNDAGDVPVPDFKIKLVNFNTKKKVTAVKWIDGTVTKVTCSDMDPFDKEKALALCYMKRWCFDNRACFNNVFKKYCGEDGDGVQNV